MELRLGGEHLFKKTSGTSCLLYNACQNIKFSNSLLTLKAYFKVFLVYTIILIFCICFCFLGLFFLICFTLLFCTGFCTTQLFEIWAQEVIVEYFLKEKTEIWYNADRPGTPFNFKIALTVAGSPEFYSRKPLEGWCGFTKEYDNSISGGNRWKLWDLFPSFRPW